MVLKGYKTITGVILSVVIGVCAAFGVLPENALVETVQTLAYGLVGYGLYDKIGRKDK